MFLPVFTALHRMQLGIGDRKAVRPSVCLSLCPSNAWIMTKRKKLSPNSYILWKIDASSSPI